GFARQHRFPGTSVEMVEHDVWPHDTGYIPYLAVSALALDAMVIAGILGAMATAREWERATVTLLRLSPASPAIVLAGTLCVGALEPTRFDGEAIWALAHLSPVYYAVGVLEWAFHGLHVTPEPVWVDLLVLVVIAVVAVILTLGRLARGATR